MNSRTVDIDRLACAYSTRPDASLEHPSAPCGFSPLTRFARSRLIPRREEANSESKASEAPLTVSRGTPGAGATPDHVSKAAEALWLFGKRGGGHGMASIEARSAAILKLIEFAPTARAEIESEAWKATLHAFLAEAVVRQIGAVITSAEIAAAAVEDFKYFEVAQPPDRYLRNEIAEWIFTNFGKRQNRRKLGGVYVRKWLGLRLNQPDGMQRVGAAQPAAALAEQQAELRFAAGLSLDIHGLPKVSNWIGVLSGFLAATLCAANGGGTNVDEFLPVLVHQIRKTGLEVPTYKELRDAIDAWVLANFGMPIPHRKGRVWVGLRWTPRTPLQRRVALHDYRSAA